MHRVHQTSGKNVLRTKMAIHCQRSTDTDTVMNTETETETETVTVTVTVTETDTDTSLRQDYLIYILN